LNRKDTKVLKESGPATPYSFKPSLSVMIVNHSFRVVKLLILCALGVLYSISNTPWIRFSVTVPVKDCPGRLRVSGVTRTPGGFAWTRTFK